MSTQNQNNDIIRIANSNEFKEKLKLSEHYLIPEFKEVLEFSRDEWEKLQFEINNKNEQEIVDFLKLIISDKIAKTKAIKENSVTGITGTKTGILKEQVDGNNGNFKKYISDKLTSQDDKILSIKKENSIESQKEEFKTLEYGVFSLLQYFLNKGVNRELIDNPEKFVEFLSNNQNNLNKQEKIISNKFIEVIGGSEYLKYFQGNWKLTLNKAGMYSQEIGQISNYINNPSQNPTITNKGGLSNFMSKHPAITGIIAVAGAAGIYSIFSSIFDGDKKSSSEDKKEGGFFEKITSFLPSGISKFIFGILGVFGLGKVLGLEGVKTYCRDSLGFNIDENRITKALELLSDFKPLEALKIITEGVKPKLNEASIDLLALNIQKKQGLKYPIDKDVLKGFLKLGAYQVIIKGEGIMSIMSNILGYFFGNSTKKDEQEEAIRDYLSGYFTDAEKGAIKDNDSIEDVIIRKNPSYATNYNNQTKPAIIAGAAVAGGVTNNNSGIPECPITPTDGEKGMISQAVEKIKTTLGMDNLRKDEEQENNQKGGDEESQPRKLYSRVLNYTSKIQYLIILHEKYSKYNGINVGNDRVHVLNGLSFFSPETGKISGEINKLIEMEKNGGLQGLLTKLHNATKKSEIKSLKAEIDSYLRHFENFERRFDLYVRNAKISKSMFNQTARESNSNIEDFESNRQKEKKLAEEVHSVAKEYDNKIKDLRKEKLSPQELAKRESEIRKEFEHTLHGPEGKFAKIREVQKDMIAQLGEISRSDAGHSGTHNELSNFERKGYIKKKKFPGGKIGWALIGITAGSAALGAWDDKEKLALTGAEAVGAFIPFVNVGLDATQVWRGKDLSGGDLSRWERFGLAPAFLFLDTVGSIASLTGIGYTLNAGIGTLKVASFGGKMSKLGKGTKEALRVAEAGHAASGIKNTTSILESLKKMRVNIVGDIRELSRIPPDFLFKYREGMRAAYGSSLLKAANPLVQLAKITVYGSIGISVGTGIGEIGSVVIDKFDGVKKAVSPITEAAESVIKK